MTQMVEQEIFTATCSNHVMTCWTFQLEFDKKDKRKAESTVANKTQKVEKHKEIEGESSEDKLPQFTSSGMRPLIVDIRLLDRRTTTNNDK